MRSDAARNTETQHPFWVSAFLDAAPDRLAAARRFWPQASGTTLSPTRGDHQEFATLIPADGHDHLRMQRLNDGPSRLHLDIHFPDPGSAAVRAEELGARIVHRSHHGYVVLSSPGGLTFCTVDNPAGLRSSPAQHDGHRSLIDQVCLDIPPSQYDAERTFWSALTGWRPHAGRRPAVTFLQRPVGQPLRILLQRLDDEQAAVTAHLDVACTDRTAEVDRHIGLGSEVLAVHDHWTVMRSPDGRSYCLTDRDPGTGELLQPFDDLGAHPADTPPGHAG